ncbi:MAG: hypothetical protein CMH49_02945 [Myxococcales bacterium]|nr:hypothetical protein [Myxococcales bacterium]
MRNSLILLSIAILVGLGLFIFQPKNVEGPRVSPQIIKTKGFPYQALDAALEIAFPQSPQGTDPQPKPRYDRLKEQAQALDHYLALISEIGPRSAPHRFNRREQRLAYMLNAYTAGLLAIVRDACPLQSVEEPYLFSGLFWRVSLRVGGEELSLNDIAAQVSTLSQGDPRVMLALSRGMQANLPLLPRAWTPDNLEKGLAELEKNLLQEPFVTKKGDELVLGAPFKWYEHRFTPSLKRYIEAKQPQLMQGVKRLSFAQINKNLDGICSTSH